MRTELFILPFLAVLVLAVGAAVKSAYPSLAWLMTTSLLLAVAMIIVWITWDLENFRRFIRRKGAKFGASSSIVVVLGIAIIVAVAYISSVDRFNIDFDATRNKTNTLSDQSLKVIAKLKETEHDPLTITAYFTTQDQEAKDTFRDLLRLYLVEGAELNVTYLDPRKNPTQAMADKLTSRNTVIFRKGKREARIATYSEEKITNALVKVLKGESKKIYFTTGHGEGELKGGGPLAYGGVNQELENNRYETASLMLMETGKIPPDADLLVIAGPKYDFRVEEIGFLRSYLRKGGAMLLMIDAVTKIDNLASFASEFGVKINNDLLLLPPDDRRIFFYGQNNALVTEFDSLHSISKDFANQTATMLIPNARSLDKVTGENEHKMNVELVAKTSKSIVRVNNVTSNADLSKINDDQVTAGQYTVIAVATGKASAPQLADAGDNKTTVSKDVDSPLADDKEKQIRLIVTGSYFARNQGIREAEHRDMFVNMSNYLLEDEDFISLRPKDITKSSLSLTSQMSALLLLLICYLYPFLFLGSGVAIWLRRRSL